MENLKQKAVVNYRIREGVGRCPMDCPVGWSGSVVRKIVEQVCFEFRVKESGSGE